MMSKIGRLKEEHRQVLTLAFFDQMPTGQIAELLGISRRAASMRLMRAIRALRRDITGSSRIEDTRDD
jgi:RNA polymerase sigma factor (sigma-70 family)